MRTNKRLLALTVAAAMLAGMLACVALPAVAATTTVSAVTVPSITAQVSTGQELGTIKISEIPAPKTTSTIFGCGS